jgi:uncharacterized protein (TIGR02596 family)
MNSITLAKDKVFTPAKRLKGFTLIEMLAVVGIVAIIVGASSLYLFGAILAMKLTTGSSEIVGALSMAQQVASSEGRNVEVRFYKHAATDDGGAGAEYFRSVVLLRYFQPGEPNPDPAAAGAPLQNATAIILGSPTRLPSGIVMSDTEALSTLLSSDSGPTTAPETMQLTTDGLQPWEFPGRGDADYRSFLIRPEGTSLTGADRWFVTVVYEQDAERNTGPSELENFSCIQIDPVNGRLLTYRP